MGEILDHQRAVVADCDLLVVGGGVNGCGIARDAAGRGLDVALVERGDLAGATSSASTKLFHGGLRYLEYFEFGLVRKALVERDALLQAMPHIARPMRFVLPYHADLRFDSETPTSRVLTAFMPWMKGRRPAWLIRLGLFLYDSLGGRTRLPGTRVLDLARAPEGAALHDRYRRAFEYSDCWVDDARLVVLNARDAADRGAEILTRTEMVTAEARDGLWYVTLRDTLSGDVSTRSARVLVNAAGPWVDDVIARRKRLDPGRRVRLVRGSHIVTRRLFDHDKAYFLQGRDGRIIFAIPYEHDFTLIGTTDVEHADPSEKPFCTDAEKDYLLAFASEYFSTPVTADDIVWTYSGVRALHDDGATSATAATRDYLLEIEDGQGAPTLNVIGGKITTYRKLAEEALEKIGAHVRLPNGPWTMRAPLPGGDFPVDGADRLMDDLLRTYPFLSDAWARRLVRSYGTEAREVLGEAGEEGDLGHCFGADLTEREVLWLMNREFARTADDVLWRRTKLGLRFSAGEAEELEIFMMERRAGSLRTAAE